MTRSFKAAVSATFSELLVRFQTSHSREAFSQDPPLIAVLDR